jgi:soluble lytic murein transglycosylase
MHGRQGLTATILLVLLSISTAAAPATIDDQRSRFKSAVEAANQGRWARFQQLRTGLENYPLEYYLDYLYLSHRLSTEIETMFQFLDRYEGRAHTELLRTRWLGYLAGRRAWKPFLHAYRDSKSAELRCAHLRARLSAGDTAGVAEATRELWLVGVSQPKMCDPLFASLYRSSLMTSELLWQRIRLAMGAGNPGLAGFIARQLPAEEQAWVTLWREVHANPRGQLRNSRLRHDSPIVREIVVHGLRRLARISAERGAAHWEKIEQAYAFSNAERARAVRSIAVAAAAQDSPIAQRWLDAIPAEQQDADVQRWQLMHALKGQHWLALERWTTEPAHPELNELRWRYWRARALEKNGRKAAADELFRSLALERDYYGFLAADRLELAYRFNHRPVVAPQPIIDGIANHDGIVRAREFFHLDMQLAARREWQQAISGFGVAEMEIAALLAHQWGWHDRTILTLGKAQSYDDLELRFPMPYRKLLEKYAGKRKLDPAYMYGIVRSESAFREDAVSPAGALGLMQVMPATGRLVAKQIGYKLSDTRALRRATTNVPIGSAYLRMMLDRYDDNGILASSAYNAGPHRVDRWLPRQACVPADVWIETIPFKETRRYTRNNAFYTAVYQWRLGVPIKPLKERLRPVLPRRSTQKDLNACNAVLAASQARSST